MVADTGSSGSVGRGVIIIVGSGVVINTTVGREVDGIFTAVGGEDSDPASDVG